MYFTAKLEIDPSQLTLIKKAQPTKLFAKLIHFLSMGQLSDKQEHETFTAVAIIQQLNMGLRSLRIKNIIRLAIDDYDFYLDEKGIEDDLEQAMYEFKAKVDPMESEFFNTIYLVLEHEDDSLKYLIEISVTRKHRVGEYPLNIHVNGVLRNFQLGEFETHSELNARMEPVFVSQVKYDGFVNKLKQNFNSFVAELEGAIKKFIKVDDIRKKSSIHVIRSPKRIMDVREVKHERYSTPVYYGYFGFDSFFFYTWLWADLLYIRNLYVNEFTLVDETGNEILIVGKNGFYAGETDTLNTNAKFDPPLTGDIQYFDNNEYSEILHKAGLLLINKTNNNDDYKDDWLDSANPHDKQSDVFHTCSSCSACGSCSNDK